MLTYKGFRNIPVYKYLFNIIEYRIEKLNSGLIIRFKIQLKSFILICNKDIDI